MADEKSVMTEKHLAFLQSRGYCKPDAEGKGGSVEDAQKFFDAMKPREQKGFLADFAKPQEPAAEESGKARTAEERDGEPAKMYRVKRHVSHNEKLHKIGETMSEEQFTPEQIDALIATGTIEEVKDADE